MKNVFLTLCMSSVLTFLGCADESLEEINQDEKLTQQEEVQTVKAQNLYVKGDSDGNRGNNWNNGFSTVWLVNGETNMSYPNTTTFLLDWDKTDNIVGGKGWHIAKSGDSNYNIEKKIKYQLKGKSGNVAFAGVYGWTTNPPIEYYVVEKGNHFLNDGGYENTKRYWANGSYYKFYKKRMPKLPSAVCNNCYFWQYVSVRESQPSFNMTGTRTINMAKHISIWKNNGFIEDGSEKRLGTPAAYQVFGVEARGSSISGNLKATVK